MDDARGPLLSPLPVSRKDTVEISYFLRETINDRERFCADDGSLDDPVPL